MDADRAAQTRRLSALQSSQLTLCAVTSRADALRIISERQPNLAVIGARLADADGISLSRELKSNSETAATSIVLIGPESSNRYADALRAGADACLPCSATCCELQAVVNALLDRPQARLAETDAPSDAHRQLEFDKVIAVLLTRLSSCSNNEIEQHVTSILRTLAENCGSDHAYIAQFDAADGLPLRITHEWCGVDVRPRVGEVMALGASPSLDESSSFRTIQVRIVGRDDRLAGYIGLRVHAGTRCTRAEIVRLALIGNAVAAILDRKKADERLLYSEAKFAAVFNACPQPILVVSVADQIVLDANPGFISSSGYRREDIVGRPLPRLAASVADHERIWTRLLKDGVLVDAELMVRAASGEVRAGMLSIGLVDVQSSRLAICIFRDVTDLRRHAAFDELMTRLLSDFLTCRTAEFTRSVDRSLARIADFFSADHVLLLDLFPATQSWNITREWRSAGVPRLDSAEQSYLLDLGKGTDLFSDADASFDVESLRDDEGYARYRAEGARTVLNVPIKGTDGVITGRIGLHRHGSANSWTAEDASRLRIVGNAIAAAFERQRADQALRRSEQQLRELADEAPVMTWISDANRRLVFYSKQALQYAGVDMHRVTGHGWIDLVYPEDRESSVAACYRALDAHEPFSVEARFRRADGEYRWILVTGIPRIINGAYRGHIGTGLDITDLRRSYERNVASQKLESLGVLAAGVAHNFNNVLGGILARADCARTGIDNNPEAIEHIDEIIKIAMRGAGTVSQLLAFASEESTVSEPVDMSRVVTDTLGLLRISTSKAADLRADLQSGATYIRGDVAEMRQLVMNLVMNGEEALQGKPGIVTVTLRRIESGSGNQVRMDVADTGVGITEEVKTRLFDPFFSTKFMGRGLGLAAAKGIVRRHGGSLEVNSAPGEGSRFTVLLPCAPSAEGESKS